MNVEAVTAQHGLSLDAASTGHELQVNATANDNPLEYEDCVHYIQGYVGDLQVIVLDNFSQNNTTHYDIYWYAVWIDGEGEQKVIERKWLYRELQS